ncbi:hypothetical protein BY458DRAFT_557499 [Sporodiniella umbellata]|nr:hypothetical protein BY458DRAFT_557499 [Sporodiniella umbellata]
MKSMTSSFEILFSKVLDIFIFASAVAITVYNYLTGTLPSQSVHIVEPPPPTLQKKMVTYKLEEEMLKKRRVHEWAEGQKTTTEKSERRHSSACLPDRKIVQPSCSMKRTQSLSCTMEEETLLKMEETLQSLILQCQETLQSPVE